MGLCRPPDWGTSNTTVLGGCPRSAEVAGAEQDWDARSLTLCPGSAGLGWAQPPAFDSCCALTALSGAGIPCTPTAALCGTIPLRCGADGAQRVKWAQLCSLQPRDAHSDCSFGGTGVLFHLGILCLTAAAGLGTCVLGAASLESPTPHPWALAMQEVLGCWQISLEGSVAVLATALCPAAMAGDFSVSAACGSHEWGQHGGRALGTHRLFAELQRLWPWLPALSHGHAGPGQPCAPST